MKGKKFHQFVVLEKGPKNTAIIDLLKNEVYQIGNDLVEQFNNRQYDSIAEFVKDLEGEELIFEVDDGDLIPTFSLHNDENLSDEGFQVEIGPGVDIDLVYRKLSGFKITRVICTDCPIPEKNPGFMKIEKNEEGFEYCKKLAEVDGNFSNFNEKVYLFNKKFNSCWGNKIAITADGKIRPCVYSKIILGDIKKDDLKEILKKAGELWGLTKDNVDVCKTCEFRYICFDCRELAYKKKGNLQEKNPNCKYNPIKGTWG